MLHTEKNSAKYLVSNVGQLVGLQTPVFCEQNEHRVVKKNLPILLFLSLQSNSQLKLECKIFIFAIDLFIDSCE